MPDSRLSVEPDNQAMSDEFFTACKLSKWSGVKDRCRWCDKKLTGRQKRWCSKECNHEAAANHYFSAARWWAKKRDNHACVLCGVPEDKRNPDGTWHLTTLEVHHRDEQAKGRHSKCSCAHHIDGLETLCQRCHRGEHRRQRPEQLRIEAA